MMTQNSAPFLALDTGSPVVSLALGRPGSETEVRTLELRRSSEHLLPQIHDMLGARGLDISQLGGLLALSGPGSFTGLRVGLATVLGLHQALGVRARAVPTLPVLARAARQSQRDGDEVVAIVDALRGEWMGQTFVFEGGEPQAVDSPSLRSAEDLAQGERRLVGFGLEALQDQVDGARLITAGPLAPLALEISPEGEWDPGSLVEPIYFRPPATTRRPA